jgi:hypothetical protein
MTYLIRFQLALAIAFLLAAVGIPVFYKHVYPDPPLLQSNTEFRRNVDSIKDIEHLRKVLYTVVVGTDKSVLANKGTVDASVDLLSALLVLAAVGFGGSCYWLHRLRKGDRTAP